MAFTEEEEIILKALAARPQKIVSDLELDDDISGDELILAEDGSSTKNITIDDIKDYTIEAAAGVLEVGKNLLINGAFAIDQRNAGASTAISDDAYCFDRWYILTQTASVNVSQQTLQEDGISSNIRITQNQTSAQRFGLAQIIEAKDSQRARAKALTLMKRVRISNSQALRYAILEWTGTADSVTSDVVNDWTSSTYTAGNFFLSSNLNVLGVGSITPSSATWTNLTKLTATAGSSTNNFIVFVWTEGVAAQNVTLDIAKAQLEVSSYASDFEKRPYALELELCKRFFEKIAGTEVSEAIGAGYSDSTTLVYGVINYKSKRVAPSISVSANADFTYGNPTTGYTSSAVTFSQIGRASSRIDLTVSGVASSGIPGTIATLNTGYILVNSEI